MSSSDACARFIQRLDKYPLWSVDTDKWAYEYSAQTAGQNTDPFVRKAMKDWDYEKYRTLDGWSKKPDLDVCLDALLSFGERIHPLSTEPRFRKCLDQAITEARSKFSAAGTLRRLSLETSADTIEVDTSAGFSFPGKKKRHCIEELFDISSYIGHQVRHGYRVYETPCLLAMRGHLSSYEDPKTRPVWVYPGEISILEGIWAVPYYKWLMSNDAVYFGEGTLRRLRQSMDSPLLDSVEVTLDWSLFDMRAQNYLIDVSFDIIKSSFSHDDWDFYGKTVSWGNQNWDRVYAFLQHYFINTRLMLPNGTIVRKCRGVPSGSMFTQAVDSIVNWIMVKTLMLYNDVSLTELSVLGDDSRGRAPANLRYRIDAAKLSEQARLLLGARLKLEKVRIVQPGDDQGLRKFIGYTVQGGRFLRKSEDWLRMALYSERDVESLEVSASRIAAYYMIGGVHDEVYCSFFRYFIACYPEASGKPLKPERTLERIFKYVFRLPVSRLVIPDLSTISPLGAGNLMGYGWAPFENPRFV